MHLHASTAKAFTVKATLDLAVYLLLAWPQAHVRYFT